MPGTAPYKNGLRTKLGCLSRGHGTVHTKLAGLIAGRAYHAPVACAAYNHEFANKIGVQQPLYRNKKRIEINMGNAAVDKRRCLMFFVCGLRFFALSKKNTENHQQWL